MTSIGASPRSVADAHHISVRHLHAVFSGEPAPVAAYIRALRLRHCARDLRDARLARVPIAELAARSGFGDFRGFERAFKSAYGVPPGMYRRRGQR